MPLICPAIRPFTANQPTRCNPTAIWVAALWWLGWARWPRPRPPKRWPTAWPRANVPLRRGYVMAVIENPYAGAYVEDIQPFMDDLKPLGVDMAKRLLAEMGGDTALVQGYGKGAIVGAEGEIEHGALWHAPGGYAMREVLGGAKAIVPSTKKVGGVGTRLE